MTGALSDAATGGARHGLWRALGVRRAEESRVRWGGALFFATMASASIGLNAADALFFLRFGVESLPWMIMLSGVVVMAVTIAHSVGLAAMGTRSWSWVVPASLAAWLIAERLAIAADLPGVYPVVWVAGQVGIYLGLTLLWDVAGELCDTRQAKRLFPLLMSAGIAGSVTGNILTGPLAQMLGTENLLVVQAVGLGVVGVVAMVTTRRFLGARRPEAISTIGNLRAGLETTVRVPLFRLVAGVGAVLSVLFFLVFFPFSEVAAANFDSEEALAGFLGLFSSIATAATFLVSLLVANRLFTRFGVVAVLLIVAVVYVAGFSLWLVSFGLVTATLFRGVQWVAANALAGTAFSALFNVLTGRRRSQVRDFVSAVPVQLGTVIGGALLLVGAGVSDTARTVLSTLVAVGFLLLVLPMRKAYSAALVEAVRHGLSEVFTATLPGMQKPHCDADTLDALTSGLIDASPGRRRVTAAILGEVGGDEARDALCGLLGDTDEAVRLEALESLVRVDRVAAVREALARLDDPSAKVRRRAVALLDRQHADAPAVIEALNDADAEVRSHAARVVGGPRGRGVIGAMLQTGDGAAVAAALRCVLAEPDLAEIDARRFAAHPDRRVRAVAAELLAADADGVDGAVELLNDPSVVVRGAAARALSDGNRAVIHDVLEHGSVRAREAALQALVSVDVTDDYLRAWAERELDRAAELYRLRTALASRRNGAAAAAEYLVRVLEKRERMVERWVVTALATEETKGVLPLVARGAISRDAEVKSEALEAVESLTDRTLARRLVSLLEDPAVGVPLDRLEALRALAGDHQHWFRALAARAIYDELSRDIEAASELASGDDSPVVRAAIPGHPAAPPPSSGTMTVVDVVLALGHASILENLDPEELEALAMLGSERRYEAGEIVYVQGAPGDELMVIVDGAAEVRVIDGAAHQTVAVAGRGEPLGELAVLRHGARMAEVRAGPDGLRAFVIPGAAFLRLVEEQPALSTALLAKLAERIAGTVDRREPLLDGPAGGAPTT